MGGLNTDQVFDRLKPIVASMDLSVVAQSVSQLPDGSYKFLCAYTKWLMPGFTIMILGSEYFVKGVEFGVSITVTGPAMPPVLTFDIYPFNFKHGTIRRVANEQNQKPALQDRLPLLWLREIVDEGLHFDQLDAVDIDASVRLYFLAPCDFPNWNQEDGDVKAIAPMRAGCNEFIKALTNHQFVAEMSSVGRVKNYNIFGNQTDSGADKNILNEPLSAVELSINIPFIKNCDCCDSELLDNRPAPGYVLDQNGNILAVLYSNETYTVQAGPCDGVDIKDQDGNTLTTVPSGGTYTVTVLAEIEDTVTANTATIIENLT